jgi:hypothetical protein
LCWIEAGLYGPATVRQILEGRHVKRGIAAHLTTLRALFSLYVETFFSDSSETLQECVRHLNQACQDWDTDEIKKNHKELISQMKSMSLVAQFCRYDECGEEKPLARAIYHYMTMVLEMLMYIRAVRSGDWNLHLDTTEAFVKYFFAHDKLNYARLTPVYLADMRTLAETDPCIWEEFMTGNWVVNKSLVPFCAIGADHALEQTNRMMKVAGGLVGITLNARARTKFFLVAPELARLVEEARSMAGTSKIQINHHHELSEAKILEQDKHVLELKRTIEEFTNPFTNDCDQIINIVTKVVLPDSAQKDIRNRNEIGQKQYEKFVAERVATNEVNLWSPMKKLNLQMWSSANKKVTLKTANEIFELREDRTLFARMLIVSEARNIDLKQVVGPYELSVVPRALFAADGSLLHEKSKSDLMAILESLPEEEPNQQPMNPIPAPKCVAIVDGMADLQSMKKTDLIFNCRDLANHFIERLWHKYGDYDEVHLVFDRYDVPNSLKTSTRERRLGGKQAVVYHITDSTCVSRIKMSDLLSHVKTKDQLTTYLAQKVLDHARKNGRNVIVAWRTCAEASMENFQHDLSSILEEADTKLILHALHATSNGATSIRIHSPDTDVLILALRRYPELCEDTCFVTGSAENHRLIPLQSIYNVLGPSKAAALPGFHAFSGADITGKFAGKGKKTCWKVFQNLHDDDDEILKAFIDLGRGEFPSETTMDALEDFVCKLYVPDTEIAKVEDLRWHLFKKKQAQSEGLPPTRSSLKPAILRAHYQAMIWFNDIVANPEIPEPQNYGWQTSDGELEPVMCLLPPAPEAVTNLVKCSCKLTQCANNRCKCRKNGLKCTSLCNCSDKEECDNREEIILNLPDSEEDDEVLW